MRKIIMISLGVLLAASLIYVVTDQLLNWTSAPVNAEAEAAGAVTGGQPENESTQQDQGTSAQDAGKTPPLTADEPGGGQDAATPEPRQGSSGGTGAGYSVDPDAVAVIAEPENITALVNKVNRLPFDYKPDDLVYPDVPFIFKEKVEKRMLRKVAAEALERLFAAAEEDGILLAGVSGYRSSSTQKALFEHYVRRDGEEAASRYSARPGHSEHQTGLAMDVSGIDGKCAATDCFANTAEAAWLAEHAHEYGFIIRYPKGKEEITGYKYEPWHLRYVGTELAGVIWEQGITLEEYYGAVPVSAPVAETKAGAEPAVQAETVHEADSGAATAPASEAESAVQTEPALEAGSGAETEPASETDLAPEAGTSPDAESHSASDPVQDGDPDGDPIPAPEALPRADSDPAPQTDHDAASHADPAPDARADAVPEADAGSGPDGETFGPAPSDPIS